MGNILSIGIISIWCCWYWWCRCSWWYC